MNEVLREFLLETHENLAQLDQDLVALEKEPTERETLARVFRTLHTVKGTAGFLGFPTLQNVAHAGENLLSRLRDGHLIFNAEIASALLGVVDAVRRMLASIEATEQEGSFDFSALIRTLEQLRAGTAVPAAPVMPVPGSDVTTFARAAPALLAEEPRRAPPTPISPPAPPTESPPTVIAPPAAEAPEQVEPRAPAVSDSAIRVDVGLLDKLMTLVGELVLARNQIMQFSSSQEDNAFLGTVQRLNLLTTELQASVMKTRMQPIGNLWNKFPRVVRDLAVACGKQVRIELDGQETELDKTIVEAIRDPLTHLVRNAVDHGIEPPAQRLAKGKLTEGRLSLHASHEGGKVIIEIVDDGGGIDPARVRDKAIAARVITAEQAQRLNERELLNLIFLPGFSTAERVTQFSGRGVGMDVVRTNVEKIGGSVDIESRLGRGTTVKMKIPLTLAIIPALTVTSGGDRYAIPQVSLLELVRLEREQVQKGIELIHGTPVYRLRGNLLPLVYLDRELQVDPASRAASAARLTEDVNIVVLQADDRHFGLIVDAIHDTEEIVVKPLQKQLKGIGVYAGATIMGDGRVALILDVLGLAQRAHVVAGVRERVLSEKAAPAEADADRQTVLLFAGSDGGRMAIPLSQVARLEEFPRSALERVGPQDVVQYRNEILPLINVSRALGRRRRSRKARPNGQRTVSGARAETVQVVVYAGEGQRVGLVVGRILDIVEESLAARARANRTGVEFTAVIQGRVTEFLDISAILRSADPAFFEPPQAQAQAQAQPATARPVAVKG
jgi:two-component system chemotaxis sensor kinase CheA